MDFIHRPEFKIIQKTYRKLDVFPSALGPVIKVSSFLGTQQSRCLPSPHLRAETGPVSETMFSSYLEIRTMEKVQKPSDCGC
jgi:hypothetical protein